MRERHIPSTAILDAEGVESTEYTNQSQRKRTNKERRALDSVAHISSGRRSYPRLYVAKTANNECIVY